MIKSNVFYVASEKTIYICWEKVNGVSEYKIYRNGEELISSDTTTFTRPYEFENDFNPHTELFKPATRNWLYFKDNSIEDFKHYMYQIIGEGGGTSEEHKSILTDVYTQ
jgi:hypothetical protein